jgi:diazepam-binding inhibitor (GABA receptor modulator, acyl-CoA-binding protein)
MAVKEDFEAAVARVNRLPAKPSQSTQLDLYSLYKQATAGDASGKRPGIMDVVGRAKFDAWSSRKGMSREDSMQAYIDLAATL